MPLLGRKLLKFYFQSFLLGVPVRQSIESRWARTNSVLTGDCSRIPNTEGGIDDCTIVQNC